MAASARLLSVCALALFASPARANAEWPVYVNVLHAYRICYPATLLVAQGEADNGDGQAFAARGSGELRVVGGYSGEGRTLTRATETAASFAAGPRGRITYRAFGETWGVASGEDGAGGIFYLKLFKRGDHVVRAKLHYPKAQADRYRPVVEQISRCFREVNGR
jgi:hypothetical protein